MICKVRVIGKDTYITVNARGTLEKLPRLKWYQVLYLVFKEHFKGGVHYSEIREMCKKAEFKKRAIKSRKRKGLDINDIDKLKVYGGRGFLMIKAEK